MNKLAQIQNPVLPNLQGYQSNPTGFLSRLLSTVITALIVGGSVYFVFMLIIGGISWIGAGGDKAKLESARGRVSQAIVGIIVLFSVFAVIKLIETIFNVDILNINLAPLFLTEASGQANVNPK